MTDDSRMLDHAGYGGAGVQAVSRVAQVEGVQPPPPVELGHTHAWCPALSAEGFQSHAKNEERTQGPALTDA